MPNLGNSHHWTKNHTAATVLTLIAVPRLYFDFFKRKPCPLAEQLEEPCETETENG